MRVLALAGLMTIAALPWGGAGAGSTRPLSPAEREIAVLEDSLMAAIGARDRDEQDEHEEKRTTHERCP